jgi:hypothetical protein
MRVSLTKSSSSALVTASLSRVLGAFVSVTTALAIAVLTSRKPNSFNSLSFGVLVQSRLCRYTINFTYLPPSLTVVFTIFL